MNLKSKSDVKPLELCQTGVPGFDSIICGGLPRDRIYLLQGQPGTGKTTFALQFLQEGIRNGEKCLYITFSETKEEILAVARSHGWNLEHLALFELSALADQLRPETQNTVFHPSEVELNKTTEAFIREIELRKPSRIVFDSISEMRLLAESSLRYRRQMLTLKTYFSGKKITVLLLDDLTASTEDLHVQSIVHGVIALEKVQPEFGAERRRINLVKLRGVKFIGGKHDYMIERGGIRVFPRLVAADHFRPFKRESISSGLEGLDRLLGGGLDRGTSNLFMGPAGSGKSTISAQYIVASIARKEKVAVFLFEENLNTFLARASSLGMDIDSQIKSGLVMIKKIDPAEVTPGEFANAIQTQVAEHDVKMIIIDSLNGYLHAMPEQDFLILQLHELLAYLNHQGIVTILVLAQQGMLGTMTTPIDLTYLADTLVITRFFELGGAVKKAISVVKKRTGGHEDTIRQFSIGAQGIQVGPALDQFHGVLTGVPQYIGLKT